MDESLQEIHILIVDDEESIRITFEMFLKREGYGKIITAATFEEALFVINEERFDLIISDIVLEGASGTDLLRHVRQTGIQCPVVMITGFPNLESATEAVRHGAFDYISKPVNKETLLRFVRQALKHWQLQKEKHALQRENEKFRRYLEVIFSSVSDAIITVNEKMEITKLNDTARTWLEGIDSGAVARLGDISGEMGRALLLDAGQAIETEKAVREHQVEYRKADGSTRMISLNASPIRDAVYEFNGAVIVARDITPILPEELQGERTRFHRFIGVSKVMQDVYRLIENVGRVDTAVLIAGESGTGKELAAEALHAESRRKDWPLVKVDCAAMPEDLLESELFGHKKGAFTGADRDRPGRLLQADKGSLFLDEIGDISPRMQLRLLRFLQEKTFNPVGQDTFVKVDVRIIAATNVDLKKKVKSGAFREDLYYRLKVVEVLLPPLRERKECIPLLVRHFLAIFRNELEKNIINISDQAMEALTAYAWPGNVRELRHVIERACVLCKGATLLREHLADELLYAPQPDAVQESTAATGRAAAEPGFRIQQHGPYLSEQQQIIQALQATGGNKAKAAKLLGVDRSTLYRKMQRYGF
ncbi:MAG: sensory box protein/sigma-54 dependent DNA-binding response regulator [uncultured bacterium]|nr:MAG: sensory box protein/sigma-54 dependent DNA-binding response regulator [uncultured bacterium]HBG19656.1 sigma-54-dependent Fis family transcriptional regulator [Desulfobulbaceae bacterium]